MIRSVSDTKTNATARSDVIDSNVIIKIENLFNEEGGDDHVVGHHSNISPFHFKGLSCRTYGCMQKNMGNRKIALEFFQQALGAFQSGRDDATCNDEERLTINLEMAETYAEMQEMFESVGETEKATSSKECGLQIVDEALGASKSVDKPTDAIVMAMEDTKTSSLKSDSHQACMSFVYKASEECNTHDNIGTDAYTTIIAGHKTTTIGFKRKLANESDRIQKKRR